MHVGMFGSATKHWRRQEAYLSCEEGLKKEILGHVYCKQVRCSGCDWY